MRVNRELSESMEYCEEADVFGKDYEYFNMMMAVARHIARINI